MCRCVLPVAPSVFFSDVQQGAFAPFSYPFWYAIRWASPSAQGRCSFPAYTGGGQIFLMDSYIGIGATSEALRPGHDCPQHATFVPVTPVNSRWTSRHSAVLALCLFEEDAGMTEWRHSIPRGEGCCIYSIIAISSTGCCKCSSSAPPTAPHGVEPMAPALQGWGMRRSTASAGCRWCCAASPPSATTTTRRTSGDHAGDMCDSLCK
jgi:Copper amine oxidase, enzyme domain